MQFTALANCVQGITLEVLLDCFVGGSEPDIPRDVIVQAPTSFLKTVSLAKLYEEKYDTKHRPLSSGFFPKTQAKPLLNP